jgi:hypothetical protein
MFVFFFVSVILYGSESFAFRVIQRPYEMERSGVIYRRKPNYSLLNKN